jgi:hypothetical protein
MAKTPKLALDQSERRSLQRAKVRLGDIAQMSPVALSDLTGIPLNRCEKLVALSQFQTLGSVGLQSALDLWVLGCRRLSDLAKAEPAEMYRRLEKIVGQSLDPCVEDVLRCAVAQSVNRDLPEPLRQWWNWQEQRGKPLSVPQIKG